jgi:thiol-disulfide isomerase/thioredoxin
MKKLRYLILPVLSALPFLAMISCSDANKKWESNPDNDRLVHICGSITNLSPRDVRISLSNSDIIHGYDFFTVKVRNRNFSADVHLDPDKVYKLAIPHHKHYSSYGGQVFFADQDTICFAYDADYHSVNPQNLILNGKGDNKVFQDFRSARYAAFADEIKSLKEEETSIRGSYYSEEFNRIQGQLDDRGLDSFARDSILHLLGQMDYDRTAYTPERRAYMERYDRFEEMELDFARSYLESRPPSLALFGIVDESLRTASELDYDYPWWVRLYESDYADRFEGCNLHESVGNIISAKSVYEGMHFIDFTLPDKDGNPKTLSQLIEGKYAVLQFWATWCGPCISKRHSLQELYDRNKDKDFTVVEVSREFRNDSRWRETISKDGAGWTDLLAMEKDHSVGNAYGLERIAGGIFLIDKEGTVIKIDPTLTEIEALLNSK